MISVNFEGAQEKADIAAGKPLVLQLWGISIPHLYLTTKNPFK